MHLRHRGLSLARTAFGGLPLRAKFVPIRLRTAGNARCLPGARDGGARARKIPFGHSACTRIGIRYPLVDDLQLLGLDRPFPSAGLGQQIRPGTLDVIEGGIKPPVDCRGRVGGRFRPAGDPETFPLDHPGQKGKIVGQNRQAGQDEFEQPVRRIRRTPQAGGPVQHDGRRFRRRDIPGVIPGVADPYLRNGLVIGEQRAAVPLDDLALTTIRVMNCNGLS